MSLLERIAVLREQHGGISINKLEKEAGITRGSIAKWDDHAPSYDKVKKVADYFGVTVEYLLHGDELPALPKQGAEKETAVPKDDGLNYTDSELLQAYHVADARTKEAIRTLLGIKGE